MKKIIFFVFLLSLLIPSVFAESILPSFDTPDPIRESAPSYSIMASVHPVEFGENYNEQVPGYYFKYENVDIDSYNRYGVYLAERSYQLLEQKPFAGNGKDVWLIIGKGEISFDIIYNADTHILIEVYPIDVEYEMLDPFYGYIEVKLNTSFKLGSRAKISIKQVGGCNYFADAKRPTAVLEVQNLTQNFMYSNSAFDVELHAFVGNHHYTIPVKDSGERLESYSSGYRLSGGSLKSLETGSFYYSFDITMEDLVNLDPDRWAISFEFGEEKYVYNFFLR